ncbi:HAD family hydrolase [Candidatus Bathyarchaeota archaeon]|nr:HAD family hydrolase [Candidatus Bathyarchaeota archaeon]
MKAVIFDLGNTLVSYYQRHEFPSILREAIGNCVTELNAKGIATPDEHVVWERVREQDHGSPRNRVYPLGERLSAIFGVDDPILLDMLCAEFMHPIFRTARLHGDAKPTLKELRRRGVKTAIISNTPWGSPPRLWRPELDRHGLTGLVDAAVFCGDVGWRKPDPRIFHFTLDRLGLEAGDCLFVGDDPRWDVAGPRAVGMEAVLIDRAGVNPGAVHSLNEILELVT